MKRPRLETNQQATKKSKTQETTEESIIIGLPKDLQMKLLSYLTLSEVLVLTQCCRGLKVVINVKAVWGQFLKRISPSILALPMNSLASTKERLKLVVGKRNWPRSLDYTKLRMHYVLEVMGNKDVATLSNATLNENSIVEFNSGKVFNWTLQRDRMESSSFMAFLIWDGRTSLLLPRTEAYELDGNDAWFSHSELVHVKVTLKRIRHRRQDSNGENHRDDPGVFNGIESVTILVGNMTFRQYSCYVLTWN